MAAAAASSGTGPPKFAILITYVLLGCAISFLLGREPGRLPEDIAVELAPSIIVIGIFLTHYSLWDCMAVGAAKQEFQKSWSGKIYREYNQLQIPEQVYLAQRVQSNQLEQLPVFLAGILSSAMLVNGLLAAIMGLAWTILRMRYAEVPHGVRAHGVRQLPGQRHGQPQAHLPRS